MVSVPEGTPSHELSRTRGPTALQTAAGGCAPSLCRTRQQYAPSLTLCIRCLPSRRCNRCYLEWRWSKFAGKDPARSLDLGGLMGDEPDRKSATAACTIPREGESASIGNGKSEAPLLPEQFEEAIDKLSFSAPRSRLVKVVMVYPC